MTEPIQKKYEPSKEEIDWNEKRNILNKVVFDDDIQKGNSLINEYIDNTCINSMVSVEIRDLVIEIFNIADEYKAILIVDEAHSSGVIGENLLGIFDYYKIKPNKYHVKMGTLGKAYGSYGAYILASQEIIDFLVNRAKPIIYSTAPSLFDTALGYESLKFIIENKKELKKRIEENLNIIYKELGIKSQSLIIPILIGDNKKAKEIQEILKKYGYLVGAIRQPTVKEAIIRLIAKIDIQSDVLTNICKLLKELNVNK